MISIVTTAGNFPPDRRGPMLAGFRANLSNSLVEAIYVVTEADQTEMTWLKDEFPNAESAKIQIVHVPARPTFHEILNFAGTLFADGSDTVAVMNADIGFASEQDAARVIESLNVLNARDEPVLLALTRHEMNGCLELYDEVGLPNCVSADCWAFQKPLTVARDLFYSLGQMNCDMLLADDLLASGYKIYNPCLDIHVIHYEGQKSNAFYAELNKEAGTRERLDRHVSQHKPNFWNYYGIPWVKTDWIKRGYRPGPTSTNGRRLIVAVSTGAEGRLSQAWQALVSLVDQHGLEMTVVYDGELDELVTQYGQESWCASRISFSSSRDGISSVRRSLLCGRPYGATSVAFSSDLSRLDQALLANVYSVYLSIQKDRPDAPPSARASLITSLYRTDEFILGFLRNCSELIAYGEAIEHIFVASALSDLEVDRLIDHLDRFPSATMLRFDKDPGLYECWRIGISVARTEYVSNANADDLRAPRHVMALVRILESHPEVAVASTAVAPFHQYPPNGELPEPSTTWYADQAGYFSLLELAHLTNAEEPRLEPHNIPHCMPVWRRSLHNRYGWFDETRFGTYADWAFWLRVLGDAQLGWLHPEPLSFYYVNLESHNRRGNNLDTLHRAVEGEVIGAFIARANHRLPPERNLRHDHPRKLDLFGHGLFYGKHRNSFAEIIHALEPLNCGAGGLRFVPFLERQFVWGDSESEGEAGSATPRPLTQPWIGILHVPFAAPDWFAPEFSPENVFSTPLFQESLPACRGIITLCADLERDLQHFLPGIRTLALRHPTELDVRMFDLSAYTAAPCVVQVGDWLRKLRAIHRLRAPEHRKVMLLKSHTELFITREIEVFGDERDPAVEMRRLVPDDEYDTLLASSVVLCMTYATAANNVVIECIARATPIIINPLPGAVEYLGEDYPFYACDERAAAELLATPGRVKEAHHYLLQRRTTLDLSYSSFCYNLAMSGFYAAL